MHEELSIERLKIELPMFKAINKFNTIEDINIYVTEQPPQIKNISRHNIINQTFIDLPLKLCVV